MFWKNVLLFCLLFMFFSCNYVLATRTDARPFTCKSNIRLIQGAIELYNMDNKIEIDRLDQDVIDNLVKIGYIKKLTKPDPKCEYTFIGDIREGGNGIIFCKYHGDIENLVYCDYYEDRSTSFGGKFTRSYSAHYKKFPQNATEAEIKNNINTIRTNKEKAIKWTKLRQTISFFIFSPFSVLFLIGLIISWYCFPKRKKESL